MYQSGSNPADIRAVIGPAIGSCCYTVDDHVIDKIRNLPLQQEDKAFLTIKEGEYRLELKEVNRQLLVHAGIDTALKATDGLYTDRPNLFLALCFADCVPVYFYDPVRSLVGIAHAGWKGTALGIAASMVDTWIRREGESEPPFHSLNTGLHVQDHEQHVINNRKKVADILKTDLHDWVFADQTHEDRIHKVTDGDRASGAFRY
ncbi:hypothetical protein DT075_23910 [Bacillus licheniformis]|nr:hypothetical protein DT075_23910 [Bacillus licheniformis]